MAFAAASKLFESGVCEPRDIDFLLLCTQSPDYFLPTTACILQHRLGIPTHSGALDFNLGCSGYIYGLGLAKGLIETGQARKVLLLTAETYSKYIHPNDKSVRTLFGDAAAATLIVGEEHPESDDDCIGPFLYGTDGSGHGNLIVPTGGMKKAKVANPELTEDASGNQRTINNLFMNGPEVFTFTLREVPKAVNQLLQKSGYGLDQIDLFVFHQANAFMLEHLRKKAKIPEEKFYVAMHHCGNTVSSTVPIALKHALQEGKIKAGDKIMLVGFGVGYSWGATLIRW